MFSRLETQPLSIESKSNSPLKDLLSGLSYIKHNHIIVALISIGVKKINVIRQPVIGILSSGDEIVNYTEDKLDIYPIERYEYIR